MKRNNLMQMLIDNITTPREFRIEASGDEATIYVYDVISSYFGISAERFAKELQAITAKVIHLRINSPGGEVFEARAMHTALRAHPAKVISHVDGLAASSASFLMLAADEIEIAPGAFIMIHKAWTILMGNSDDCRATADLLDQVDGTIMKDYMNKTGLDEATLNEWISNDKWFTGEEAVEHGFADRLSESAATQNSYNLAAFANVPKALTEKPAPSRDWELLDRRLSLLQRAAA